jgi:SAM-dependent methyltransferase
VSTGGGPAAGDAAVRDEFGAATAEFHDLLASSMWEGFGLLLLDLLADVDPSVGPILDVGTGTGFGLAYLRAAVTGCRVFAVEPSRGMRTALHARLHDQAGDLGDVTVWPTPLLAARLPERACALVAATVLGHLSQDERDLLWRFVAERMPAGSPAVVGVLPPARPVSVPLVRYGQRAVGDLLYEGWQSGEPIDDHTMARTMVYRVVHAATGELVAEHRATAPWRCDSIDDVRAEVARFGLEVTAHPDCVVVRRPVTRV